MISILIDNRESSKVDEKKIRARAKETLFKNDAEGNLEISIIFVDESQMAKINKDYRGIDKPTCVLSFCQNEQFDGKSLNSGQVYPKKEIAKKINFPKTLGIKVLGDIIVCPKVAKEKGYSLEFLVSHGVEHLLGIHHEQSNIPFKIQTKKDSGS